LDVLGVIMRALLVLAFAPLFAGCRASDPPVESAPCGGAGVICHVAGTNIAAFDGDGRPAIDSSLYLPSAARLEPDGQKRLHVIDFNNQRVRCVEADGSLQTVIGSGIHGPALSGVSVTKTPLDNPQDIAFASDGSLVLVNYHDPRVFRISKGVVQAIAGTGDPGDGGDGGPALEATFQQIAGIALGPDGAIYVSDDKAHRVRVIKNGMVSAFAGISGDTAEGYAGDGGPATSAKLSKPMGLAVDAQGRVYIADSGNDVVRRVDKGIITTIAGNGEEALSGDGGPATKAAMFSPHGIEIAPDGSLYVSDYGNDRIRRIDAQGIITTIAGSTMGHSGDGGPATQAQLHGPNYFTVTADAIYFADQLNNAVRVIHLR
jgi:hypothetical protein